MADQDQGTELPQRVPSAARPWPGAAGAPGAPGVPGVPGVPGPPVALALPEELRRRLQAAVKAERAQAAGSIPERAAGDRTAGLIAGPEPAARPGPAKPRRRARGRLIALGLAVVVIGSLAAVVAGRASLSPSAVRAQAAAWVAEQVSPGATVSCDPVMCAALQAHGFPVSKLVLLGSSSTDPPPSALVVETATVRDLFGTSLATAGAPAVLASFGSGTSAITVRVVAPHGGAAYRAAVSAGLASRISSGAALLRNAQVSVSAVARGQLLAGQVDSRLLLALAALAGQEPIDIVRFGNVGTGASPGVLLRSADLAESIPAAHLNTAAYARAAWADLNALDARIRPIRAVSGPVQGQAIFRVEFPAPSPLGDQTRDGQPR